MPRECRDENAVAGCPLEPVLESLVAALVTEPWRYATVDGEASRPYTAAYARMIMAEGFSRLGNHERARQLCRDASTVLDPVVHDPIHGYLAGAFTARIEQGCQDLPRDTALPERLVSRLEALDRVERYKVDRLREMSPILASDIPVQAKDRDHDAIGSFKQRVVRPRDQAGNPLRATLRAQADPTVRAREIERQIDQHLIGAIFVESSHAVICTCFDLLHELPEEAAVPIVACVIPVIQSVRPAVPPDLCARLLAVAARFGFGEFVPDLVGYLRHAIRRSGITPSTLAAAIRACRTLGLREELRQLIDDVERTIVDSPVPTAVELVIAGARAFLADPRAEATFERAHLAFARRPVWVGGPVPPRPMSFRLDLARALVAGASHAPMLCGIRQIEQLAPHLRDTSDAFGTNTHYSLSVLHFVESIVLGVTDLSQSHRSIRDPADARRIPLRYALD